MKKDNSSPHPPRTLVGLIKSIIKYPFKISGMYSSYNKGLGDLISVKNEPALFRKDDEYFKKIQKKNNSFVWGFIFSPILIGILVSALFIFMERDRYQNYFHVLSLPVKEDRLVKQFSMYWKKTVYLVVNQPLTVKDLTPFLIGYLVSILGANFCSKNPTFQIQDKMRGDFLAMGCVDINGDPWRVVWTPEALLITSFGRDPNQLHGDQKFWTSINFPPSVPKQSRKDMNKFVVQRKYELSGNMEITWHGDKKT